MTRTILLPCLLAVLSGCGPLTFPAVHRLKPEEQAQVESIWTNMLAPPNRLDRSTLLDVLVAYQLHSTGIDRVRFVGEKQTPVGRVSLTVDFDRAREDNGTFAFVLTDPQGKLMRHEVYTADEVFKTVTELNERETRCENGHEVHRYTARAEARLNRISAATQPAK